MTLHLSGYRILWILVLFDLPVGTKEERKAATEFRDGLCDLGFEMAQFSVYMKWCNGYDSANTWIKRVSELVPKYGLVHVLTLTDKQYETMLTFTGGGKKTEQKLPMQYELF